MVDITYEKYLKEKTKEFLEASSLYGNGIPRLSHQFVNNNADIYDSLGPDPREEVSEITEFLRWSRGTPNKVAYWETTDSEELYNRNIKNQVYKNIFREYNYLKPIEYKHNSEGFRSDEFVGKGVATFGDSYTYGTGLRLEETWGNKLAKKLNVNHFNFGISGTSSDTAFRLLSSYIDYLDIETVAVFTPSSERREGTAYNVFPEPHPFKYKNLAYGLWSAYKVNALNPDYKYIDTYVDTFYLNDPARIVNQTKNLLALEMLCNQKNIKFVAINISDFRKFMSYKFFDDSDPNLTPLCRARDLQHWGSVTHDIICDLFLNRLNKEDKNFTLEDYDISLSKIL